MSTTIKTTYIVKRKRKNGWENFSCYPDMADALHNSAGSDHEPAGRIFRCTTTVISEEVEVSRSGEAVYNPETGEEEYTK